MTLLTWLSVVLLQGLLSSSAGGQRFSTPKEILAKKPTELVRMAVKGMLPKNRLGSKLLNNLYLYQGSEHPHEAQKPKTITLNEI